MTTEARKEHPYGAPDGSKIQGPGLGRGQAKPAETELGRKEGAHRGVKTSEADGTAGRRGTYLMIGELGLEPQCVVLIVL